MITTLLGPISTATATTVAELASILTVLCVLPLCWQTWRGKAQPSAVTWGIWAPVGFVATIGMALGGAPFGAWLLKAALSSGPLLVFVVAAQKGLWQVDRREHPEVVATIGIVGTVAYILIYSGVFAPSDPVTAGVIAVSTAMLVDTVGAWPTWVRAWHHPYGELRLTYGLALLSVTAVLLTLPLPWTFLSAGLLCFLWLQMLSIITVLTAGRIRIARGYSDRPVGHPGVA